MWGWANGGMGKLSDGHIGDGSRENAAYLFLFKLMALEKFYFKFIVNCCVYYMYLS